MTPKASNNCAKGTSQKPLDVFGVIGAGDLGLSGQTGVTAPPPPDPPHRRPPRPPPADGWQDGFVQNVAAAALGARRDGRALALARAMNLKGLGSRRPDQAALFDPTGPVHGELLGGVADEAIAATAARLAGCELLPVRIGDEPAVRAGLACGGAADVVIQDLRLVPPSWWQALLDRVPAALVTPLGAGAGAGTSRVVTASGRNEAEAGGDPVMARLREGRTSAAIVDGELVEVWWPTPRVRVLGRADLAGALQRQGALLGWTTELDPGEAGNPAAVGDDADRGSPDDSVASAAALGPADALVVLTHDHELATPALAAALTGRAGYVGALGSRHTQVERRAALVDLGVAADDIARLHGPVGLDLGARSPEEQALAICAEIVANRSGRSAGALRDSTGPING